MAFIIFYCDRREKQTLIWEEDSKRLRAPEGFFGWNKFGSQQLCSDFDTHGQCQAVPNAPVSSSAAKSILPKRKLPGMVPRAELLWHRRLGEAERGGPDKILKYSKVCLKTHWL